MLGLCNEHLVIFCRQAHTEVICWGTALKLTGLLQLLEKSYAKCSGTGQNFPSALDLQTLKKLMPKLRVKALKF